MYQAFTGSPPWQVGGLGLDSEEKQWANLHRQHQTWVCFLLSYASTQKLCCPVHSSRACTGLLALLADYGSNILMSLIMCLVISQWNM